MKKLWKGLSIGLLTMMMAAGCSSNTAQPEENTDDTPVTETTWEDQLIEKGKISIGISPDYPPYESYDENNEIVREINWEWIYGKLKPGTYRFVTDASDEKISVTFVIK